MDVTQRVDAWELKSLVVKMLSQEILFVVNVEQDGGPVKALGLEKTIPYLLRLMGL
jgi:hypothetical protein